MTARLWLSGAGGFIGHHVLEHVLSVTDWDVECTDSFRHKGRTDRIAQVLDGHPEWRSRVRITTHDLTAPLSFRQFQSFGRISYMIAMASESHVDRSIEDPVPFVRNNVEVVLSTLELARFFKPRHVILISTDEVYGPVRPGHAHREWSPILPSNPYSASKAAQEAIAIAWWRSYGVPMTIVNCMNLFGERQSPEKYLPMLIKRINAGARVGVHGDILTGNIGTRHYLHARNLADALVFLLTKQTPKPFRVANRPDRWNIASPDAISNLDLANHVADIIGKPLQYDVVDFHSARPGHDPHYGLDPRKLESQGWKPPVPFAESLERTVRWTLNHPEWLLDD